MDYTALSLDNDFQKWFKYQPLDAQIVRYAKDKSSIIAAGQKIMDVYNAFANAKQWLDTKIMATSVVIMK